ncbi:hypothetical protein GN956_G20761 [Arapaima gigas]
MFLWEKQRSRLFIDFVLLRRHVIATSRAKIKREKGHVSADFGKQRLTGDQIRCTSGAETAALQLQPFV